jgi:predicted nucleic acid-binding protein
VLLDILTRDQRWLDWSSSTLSELADSHFLVINPIIMAEISVYVDRFEDVDSLFPATFYRREALPWEAAFLAGKCFVRYRRAGGGKHTTLPDFFIGAHAAVKNMTLVTRDPKRFRTYFPTVRIVSP